MPSGSLEPEPSKVTGTLTVPLYGPFASQTGGSFGASPISAVVVHGGRGAVVVGDGERHGEGAGRRVGVGRVRAGVGRAVAEVPDVRVDGAVGVARAGAVEADRLADRARVGTVRVADRRLVRGFADLGGGRAARAATVVIGDRERHGEGAGRRVGVGRVRSGVGRAVAEVPGVGVDRPVGVARAGAVEADRLADRARVWAVGVADRGLVGLGRDVGGRLAGRAGAVVIGDREGHGEGAGRGVGVGRVRAGVGRPVAEVPGIGVDRAVGIARSGAVEADRLPDRAVVGPVRIADRRLVRGLADLGGRRAGGRGAVVIGDREADGEGAARQVGVRRVRAGAGRAVAEVPGVGVDRAVGIA